MASIKHATLTSELAQGEKVGSSHWDAEHDVTLAISDTTGLQAALDAKAPLASPTFTGTVSGITKSMVGLGNADNTSDANKPVSTAQQTALDLKANLASPALTGTPTAPTAAAGTSTTQLATTAFVAAAIQQRGTSFPGSPATDDLFYRTDRRIQYFYDGTRWLSTWIGILNFGSIGSASADAVLYAAIPFEGQYDIYLESITYMTHRLAAGEWDLSLIRRTSASASTTIWSRDGSADADNVVISNTDAIGAVLDASAEMLLFYMDEISGTTTASGSASLQFRLIG